MTIPLDPSAQRAARRLRDVVEPLAASVYFAPEVHDAFDALGFGPSAGVSNGVAGPERRAYFASRAGCIGQVPGEVVASAFGVFNPAAVVPLVDQAWAITDVTTLLTARLDGQRAFLERVLADMIAERPGDIARATTVLARMAGAGTTAGHPLYAGLRSLGFPGDAIGDLWRAADQVREHRGDSHTAAWVGAGFSAPEILLLTERWWRIPPRSYSATRAWSSEDFDAAERRLAGLGLTDGDQLTPAGLAARQDVETTTDLQELPLLAAAGDDLDELLGLLAPMAEAILGANGYPKTAFSTASDLDA
ncbi:MAG: SCO6745 family protein [Acidimicrobiales bacterium]